MTEDEEDRAIQEALREANAAFPSTGERSDIRRKMQQQFPNTTNALTWLVPSMEKAAQSAGKKTIFGKDKFQIAYEKVMEKVGNTLLAMEADGMIGAGLTAKEVEQEFIKVMTIFREAYPNWPEAYDFFGAAFVRSNNKHLRTLIDTFVSSRFENSYNKWDSYVRSFLDKEQDN